VGRPHSTLCGHTPCADPMVRQTPGSSFPQGHRSHCFDHNAGEKRSFQRRARTFSLFWQRLHTASRRPAATAVGVPTIRRFACPRQRFVSTVTSSFGSPRHHRQGRLLTGIARPPNDEHLGEGFRTPASCPDARPVMVRIRKPSPTWTSCRASFTLNANFARPQAGMICVCFFSS
jgi:hypothetical protein